MAGYIGARSVSLNTTVATAQDVTATDTTPEVTIINNTHEDTDGGREGKVIFKGQQSGGEESTLAEIQGSHDGTADDEKGDLIFKTNDGSDGASPTERMRIDSNGSILTATLGTDNVHLGEGAGNSIASGGNYNVTIGKNAGTATTTGDDNVAVGNLALKTNTGGGQNVAVGSEALEDNTGGNNVGVGFKALHANSSGANNTAIGSFSLASNTIGGSNVAIGNDSMDSNTEGEKNVAVGVDALQANTTADGNTALGWSALQAVSSGENNTAVGAYAAYNNVGESNTAVGYYAYADGVSGDFNSCFGFRAGEDISTSSDKNTCIGAYAGSNMTSSATNNVMLGYDTATNAANDDYQIIIGTQMNGVGPEYFTFGNNSRGRVYNQFSANASWTRTSDERIKKDIETNTDCGLDFINDLRTVTYKWKPPSEHPETFLSYDKDITEASHTEKMYGFIAQEVKAAMDTHNITGFNGWHVTPESQGSQQGVSYEMFVMPLVKAVQELSAEVETLKTKVAALEAE